MRYFPASAHRGNVKMTLLNYHRLTDRTFICIMYLCSMKLSLLNDTNLERRVQLRRATRVYVCKSEDLLEAEEAYR